MGADGLEQQKPVVLFPCACYNLSTAQPKSV